LIARPIAQTALRFTTNPVASVARRGSCRLALLVALPVEPRDLFLRPRLIELRLQLVDRSRTHGTALPARYDESHGTIERRHFCFGQRSRDLLREP